MKIHIVEIHEWVSCHGTEIDAMAFSSREKAESWVESQIDSYVKELDLDRESAVDGYEIALAGNQRSIKRQLQNLGRDGLRPVRGRDRARPSHVGTAVLQLPLKYRIVERDVLQVYCLDCEVAA